MRVEARPPGERGGGGVYRHMDMFLFTVARVQFFVTLILSSSVSESTRRRTEDSLTLT